MSDETASTASTQTTNEPAGRWKGRDRAPWDGLGGAALILIAVFAIVYLMIDQWIGGFPTLFEWSMGIAGGIVLLVGIVGRFHAQNLDRRNFEISKSVPLSLASVDPGERVWIEGTIVVENPVTPANTDLRCAYFRYEESETRDGKKVHTTDEVKFAPARLAQGAQSIQLPMSEATKFEFLRRRTGSHGRIKFSVAFIEAGQSASASGMVERTTDGEWRLVPAGPTVPVLVTPYDRSQWIDRAEARETRFWIGSAALIFFGISMTLFGALTLAAGMSALPALGFGVAVGLGVLIPVGIGNTLGNFSTYRQRVESVWTEVADDFSRRREFITELAEYARATNVGLTPAEADRLAAVSDRVGDALPAETAGATAATAGGTLKARIGFWRDRLDDENDLSKLMHEFLPVVRARLATHAMAQKLIEMEDEIAFDRTLFNAVARDYNTLIEAFPFSLVASMFGHVSVPYWTFPKPADTAAVATAKPAAVAEVPTP